MPNLQAKAKVPINETFMSLILHNAKSSPSFAKYIHKEQERIEDENRGFRADPTSPRSHKLTGDARIAEQQLFVTDVLYELSKEFVYKMEAAPQLNPKTIPKSSKLKRCVALFLSFIQERLMLSKLCV